MRRGGDEDAAGRRVGFHAAREVHGVAPQVVGKLLGADDAGDDRPGVDADPHVERRGEGCREARQLRLHRERETRNGGGVISARHGQAAHDHVGVADHFNFFEAVLVAEMVEGGEDFIQPAHEFGGGDGCREVREADEIAEQHGDLGKTVGDDFFAALQPLGDGLGQDVQQEPFGKFLLGLQLLEERLLLVAEPFFRERGFDARHEQHGVERLRQKIIRAELDAAHHIVNLVRR